MLFASKSLGQTASQVVAALSLPSNPFGRFTGLFRVSWSVRNRSGEQNITAQLQWPGVVTEASQASPEITIDASTVNGRTDIFGVEAGTVDTASIAVTVPEEFDSSYDAYLTIEPLSLDAYQIPVIS